MDISLIAAASSAISSAREIGKAAIGLRDFNQLAVVMTQLNDQILKAQDSLFSHQTQLLALHEELIQTKEKLRCAEKMMEDRGSYELFPITNGVFVYRNNPGNGSGQSDPTKVLHYLCQPCFDGGKKGVLVRLETPNGVSHTCPLCKTTYVENRSNPQRAQRTAGRTSMSY